MPSPGKQVRETRVEACGPVCEGESPAQEGGVGRPGHGVRAPGQPGTELGEEGRPGSGSHRLAG